MSTNKKMGRTGELPNSGRRRQNRRNSKVNHGYLSPYMNAMDVDWTKPNATIRARAVKTDFTKRVGESFMPLVKGSDFDTSTLPGSLLQYRPENDPHLKNFFSKKTVQNDMKRTGVLLPGGKVRYPQKIQSDFRDALTRQVSLADRKKVLDLHKYAPPKYRREKKDDIAHRENSLKMLQMKDNLLREEVIQAYRQLHCALMKYYIPNLPTAYESIVTAKVTKCQTMLNSKTKAFQEHRAFFEDVLSMWRYSAPSQMTEILKSCPNNKLSGNQLKTYLDVLDQSLISQAVCREFEQQMRRGRTKTATASLAKSDIASLRKKKERLTREKLVKEDVIRKRLVKRIVARRSNYNTVFGADVPHPDPLSNTITCKQQEQASIFSVQDSPANIEARQSLAKYQPQMKLCYNRIPTPYSCGAVLGYASSHRFSPAILPSTNNYDRLSYSPAMYSTSASTPRSEFSSSGVIDSVSGSSVCSHISRQYNQPDSRSQTSSVSNYAEKGLSPKESPKPTERPPSSQFKNRIAIVVRVPSVKLSGSENMMEASRFDEEVIHQVHVENTPKQHSDSVTVDEKDEKTIPLHRSKGLLGLNTDEPKITSPDDRPNIHQKLDKLASVLPPIKQLKIQTPEVFKQRQKTVKAAPNKTALPPITKMDCADRKLVPVITGDNEVNEQSVTTYKYATPLPEITPNIANAELDKDSGRHSGRAGHRITPIRDHMATAISDVVANQYKEACGMQRPWRNRSAYRSQRHTPYHFFNNNNVKCDQFKTQVNHLSSAYNNRRHDYHTRPKNDTGSTSTNANNCTESARVKSLLTKGDRLIPLTNGDHEIPPLAEGHPESHRSILNDDQRDCGNSTRSSVNEFGHLNEGPCCDTFCAGSAKPVNKEQAARISSACKGGRNVDWKGDERGADSTANDHRYSLCVTSDEEREFVRERNDYNSEFTADCNDDEKEFSPKSSAASRLRECVDDRSNDSQHSCSDVDYHRQCCSTDDLSDT